MDHQEGLLVHRHLNNRGDCGCGRVAYMPIKTWKETQEDWDEIVAKANKKGILWTLRNLGNLIDDYPDWLKEKIHGARIGKYEINISVLMKNRKPKTWDIIRKWLPEGYPNSDPEDRRA